jgi:hypothetical protein
VISNVVGILPQALEIVFEMKRKRSNEKITRRRKKKKKLSNLRNTFFSVLLLFGPLLLSKLLTFSFLVHLTNLKCYWIATFSSTNHL